VSLLNAHRDAGASAALALPVLCTIKFFYSETTIKRASASLGR